MEEELLVTLIKENDEQAMRVLVESHQSCIEKLTFQLGVIPDHIANVVENAFAKIYEKIQHEEIEHLNLWIYRLTIKAVSDYFRKQKRNKSDPSDYRDVDYRYYFDLEEHILLQESISELHMKLRVPLILFSFHEKSHDEIASFLKLKQSTVENRIRKAIDLLNQLFANKVKERAIIRSITNIEPLLDEIIIKYEQLPPFANKDHIMMRMRHKEKKPIWKKGAPVIGGVIGISLFVILTLYSLEPQETTDKPEKTEEENIEEEEGNFNPGNLQDVKKLGEIQNYYDNAKKEFMDKLGLTNIDAFLEVEFAEDLMRNYSDDTHGMREQEFKQFMDDIFQTPNDAIEKMDSYYLEGETDDGLFDINHELSMLISKLTLFSQSAQSQLDQLLKENNINVEEQLEIFHAQNNIAEYGGPDVIRELMKMLHEQGYALEMNANRDYLMVKVDESWLGQQMNRWQMDELYQQIVQLIVKHDVVRFGEPHIYEKQMLEWDQLTNLILEIEDILLLVNEQVEDQQHQIIHHLYYVAAEYLNMYVNGGMYPDEPITEELQQEWRQFLDHHNDSKFSSIIHSHLHKEVDNGDVRHHSYITDTEIRILFDDRFSSVEYEDIKGFDHLLSTSNSYLYDKYIENLDQSLLLDVDALDVFSLFITYIMNKSESYDVEFLTSLYTTNSEWNHSEQEIVQEKIVEVRPYLDELVNVGSYAIEKTIDSNTIIYRFINPWEELKLIGDVTMKSENGTWKIHDFTFEKDTGSHYSS